jgi:hypothetical protein
MRRIRTTDRFFHELHIPSEYVGDQQAIPIISAALTKRGTKFTFKEQGDESIFLYDDGNTITLSPSPDPKWTGSVPSESRL